MIEQDIGDLQKKMDWVLMTIGKQLEGKRIRVKFYDRTDGYKAIEGEAELVSFGLQHSTIAMVNTAKRYEIDTMEDIDWSVKPT